MRESNNINGVGIMCAIASDCKMPDTCRKLSGNHDDNNNYCCDS